MSASLVEAPKFVDSCATGGGHLLLVQFRVSDKVVVEIISGVSAIDGAHPV